MRLISLTALSLGAVGTSELGDSVEKGSSEHEKGLSEQKEKTDEGSFLEQKYWNGGGWDRKIHSGNGNSDYGYGFILDDKSQFSKKEMRCALNKNMENHVFYLKTYYLSILK